MKSSHYKTFGEEDMIKSVENGNTNDVEESSTLRQNVENRFISGTISGGGLLLLFITMTITVFSYTNVKVDI